MFCAERKNRIDFVIEYSRLKSMNVLLRDHLLPGEVVRHQDRVPRPARH